ncbi:MAG: hypothetical protein ABSH51_29095 [Solirubrobacteraceae bacterium]
MGSPLIVQLPRGGALARRLDGRALPGAAAGELVIQSGPTDEAGHLEPPAAGSVVLSLPAPEAIEREADEVRRVIGHAGTGVQPLVIVVEVAEDLSDDQLVVVLAAARRATRSVILRVIRDA